jgi:hypothetical protein
MDSIKKKLNLPKKPARALYNGQAHYHDEADLLTQSF